MSEKKMSSCFTEIKGNIKTTGSIHISRGKYIEASEAKDKLYALQIQYSRCIYSHETALFLHGFSGAPKEITVTCPQGYNVQSLKKKGIVIKKVILTNYGSDIEECKTPFGNPVRVYSIERTLCDILRGSGSELSVINSAMKRYAALENRNPEKLLEIADRLHVRPKVLRYMEVLL